MKKFNLSFGDGFPLDQETLKFMEASYFEGIGNLSKAIGDYIILSGCDVSGQTISNGWVIYENEIVFVQGGTKLAGEVWSYQVLDNNTSVTYQGGSVNAPYTDKYIKMSGTGDNFFIDFKRITSLLATNTKVSTLETNYTALQTSLTTLQGSFNSYVTSNNSRVLAIENQPYKIIRRGSVSFSDVPVAPVERTVTFPILEYANYTIIGAFKSLGTPLASNMTFCTYDHLSASFKLVVQETGDLTQGSFVFEWFMIEKI